MVRPLLRLLQPSDYTMPMSSDMPDTVLFEASIVPHCSLSAAGRRRLMLAMAGVCGLVALRFWFLGAWPIVGFCGLEGALAIVLIHLNGRRAKACELVMLTTDSVRIVRTEPSGRRSDMALSSAWLTVALDEQPGRVPRLYVGLRASWHEIGAALGEAEKRDLAAALRAALHRARNPVFDREEPASDAAVWQPTTPRLGPST